MYRFSPLTPPLDRLFVGRGEFRGEKKPGKIQLSADYAFELVWRVHEDGSLSLGRIDAPAHSPFEIEVPPSSIVQTVGYRLRPEAVSALLRVDVERLTSGSVSVADFDGPIRHLAKAGHQSEIEDRMRRFVLGVALPDEFLLMTMDRLFERGQRQSLEKAVSGLGYSHSQMSRRFQRATGVSLNLYSRLVRLQSAGEALRTGRVNGAGAARIAGFADASHLSHECRRLTGRSFREFTFNYSLPR